MFGGYTDACEFQPVDHAAIARACGCAGMRIDRAEALRPALATAMEAREPTLLYIIADPDAHPPITSFAGRFGSPF